MRQVGCKAATWRGLGRRVCSRAARRHARRDQNAAARRKRACATHTLHDTSTAAAMMCAHAHGSTHVAHSTTHAHGTHTQRTRRTDARITGTLLSPSPPAPAPATAAGAAPPPPCFPPPATTASPALVSSMLPTGEVMSLSCCARCWGVAHGRAEMRKNTLIMREFHRRTCCTQRLPRLMRLIYRACFSITRCSCRSDRVCRSLATS